MRVNPFFPILVPALVGTFVGAYYAGVGQYGYACALGVIMLGEIFYIWWDIRH